MFEKLFSPINIGPVEIKNRFVMAPTGTRMAAWDSTISQTQYNYYMARAKGGVGLIIVEATYLKDHPNRLSITHERHVQSFKRLVDDMHGLDEDVKVAIQINPSRGIEKEEDPEGPSEVPSPITGIRPRAITRQEIKWNVEGMVEAVKKARRAGFDMVQVHSTHGYLLHEFLTPLFNRRTDEYGGDLEGRMRFSLEMAQAIREEVSSDYPILYRIPASDFVEGGWTVDDAVIYAKRLEELGVNAIDVSAANYHAPFWIFQPIYMPHGCLLDQAAKIKMAVDIPIIAGGRIIEPTLAEKALKDEKADMIFLCRALLCDPEFPKKSEKGNVGDILKCIACNRCIETNIRFKRYLRCSVNPGLGREGEPIEPTKKPKRILVIGGGPAGMVAAFYAKLRGHYVILCEKKDKVGGQLLHAAKNPYKKFEMKELISYLSKRVKSLGIEVKMKMEIDEHQIDKIKPDLAIVATGALPYNPEIAGIEKDLVVHEVDVYTGYQVKDEVVVVGRGIACLDMALYLSEQGKKVSVVNTSRTLAGDVEMATRLYVLHLLNEKKVNIYSEEKAHEYIKGELQIYPSLKIREILDDGIVGIDGEGREKHIYADNVVITGFKFADKKVAGVLKSKEIEFYEIGDCVRPRKVLDAIHEGFNTALKT